MLESKRFELIKMLNSVIDKYSSNNMIKSYIVNAMTSRNILGSYATRFLGKKVSLVAFDLDNDKNLYIMYVFTKAFQEALQQQDRVSGLTIGTAYEMFHLDVNSYFTELEVERFNNTESLPETETSKYPYVFDNVLKVSEGHYITIVSAQALSDIDNANDIQYNFNTQRDAKVDSFGMKKINVNQKKIKEIRTNLLNGTQFSDEIKINVLRDGEDNVQFKSKNGIMGKLIIDSGTLNIFDGYHRKTANSLAILDNPNLNFNWKLTITNFTEEKAKNFMVQINKQTPMKKEYIKNLDLHLVENVIVDLINDDPSSIMYNQIKDDINELKFSGFTRKIIMATAIRETYNEIPRPKAKEFADYITKFLNSIDELIAFGGVSRNQNIFYLYIALSSFLYKQLMIDKTMEFEDIRFTLQKLDFNSEEYWMQYNLFNSNLNKTDRTRLYKLAKELI